MSEVIISKEIKNFINELTKKYKAIEEIWLIGSRANGTAKVGSDWDLLVKCNESLILDFKRDLNLKKQTANLAIELLVGYNGDCFVQPWKKKNTTRDGYKSLSLNKLKWEYISPKEAKYEGWKPYYKNGTKKYAPVNGRGIRIWP